jgi:transposase
MIQLTPQMRILVAAAPVDFRKGIDGLCRLCRQVLQTDPFTGTVFVFRSRSGTAVKILAYDGQGFWLAQKRLSQGRFSHWPGSQADSRAARQLFAHELHVLLAGGDPDAARAAPAWKPIAPTVMGSSQAAGASRPSVSL